jgi:predicted ATPase
VSEAGSPETGQGHHKRADDAVRVVRWLLSSSPSTIALTVDYIRSITIEGLRGFADAGQLLLAVPTRDEPGSGLTVLLGPNNGGKSTVAEAFRAIGRLEGASFREGTRNIATGEHVELQVETCDCKSATLRTVGAGGSATSWTYDDRGRPDVLDRILVLPARRTFPAYFSGSPGATQEREKFVKAVATSPFRGDPLNYFGQRLFRIQEDPEAFNALLTRLVGRPIAWHLEESASGQWYLKISRGAGSHSSEGLGEGLVSLIMLASALFDSKPGHVIVIDEPEMSLHPALQQRLLEVLVEHAATRQIVIATHSPYMVGWQLTETGAKIARVSHNGQTSQISQISADLLVELDRVRRDRNNPHVLGLDATSAFFLEDNVVLVEGQEDALLYPSILKTLGVELNGSVYGWGVGGAGKMRLIARLLSELGFERVAGVLDGNMEEEVVKLRRDFPRYRFVSIPANDVRTKPAVAARDSTQGLLDEEGRIREDLRDRTKTLFQELKDYLRSSGDAVEPKRG